MKKICCLLFSILLIQALNAQKATRQVLGSFAMNNKIINYHFRFSESDKTYGFTLFERKTRSDLNVKVDKLKLDSTRIELDSAMKLISATTELSDSAKQKLNNLISSGKTVITDLKARDSVINTIIDFSKTLNSNLKDSNSAKIVDSLLNKIKFKSYTLGELDDILTDIKKERDGDYEEYFYVNTWNIDVFREIFSQALAKTSVSTDFRQKNAKEIDDRANSVFYEIIARNDFINDNPVAAYIQLNDLTVEIIINIEDFQRKEGDKTVKVSRLTGTELSFLGFSEMRKHITPPLPALVKDVPITFEVKEITIEFEDGTIKNIFADMIPYYNKLRLGPPNFTIRFRNSTPISISGKYDPEKFVNYSIWASDPRELYKYLIPVLKQNNRDWPWDDEAIRKMRNKDYRNHYESDDFSISLSDLIRYDPVSENDNEDYSPANTVVKLSPQSQNSMLTKENRSKIITVKVFSDFIGIRDDQPNGLIQFEASRKMNIWTKRRRFLGMPISETSYFWVLTYLEPRLLISKVENNNKALILDTTNVDMDLAQSTGKPNFHLNALQLRQYQNFNFGVCANIFRLNFHNVKSAFHLNMHASYSRTLIADSLKFAKDVRPTVTEAVQSRNINSYIWGFNIIYEVKPDSRYGFQFGYEWNKVNPKNEIYSLDPRNSMVQTFWSEGFLKTNEESKLFFRFRYNNLINQPTINFMQVQLGYLIDLFKNAKKPAGSVQLTN